MAETVLITGVSSGLGHGLASLFLERGWRVFGCSRRKPGDLVERGLDFCSLDLSDSRTGRRTLEAWDLPLNLDLVVLNAGKLGRIRDMTESPLEDLRDTMEINVWANKWILDVLFERADRIAQVVAISSGASQSGSRGWNGYSLSKAALNMLVKLYAAERPETHFSAFAPGLIDTGMQDYLTRLPEDGRFQTLERLKSAKGTEAMPGPEACARLLVDAFPRLLNRESGVYTDIREM